VRETAEAVSLPLKMKKRWSRGFSRNAIKLRNPPVRF